MLDDHFQKHISIALSSATHVISAGLDAINNDGDVLTM